MILVADIGGTHTRVAVSEDGKTLSDSLSFATPIDDAEKGFTKIAEAAQTLLKGARCTQSVIGIAGVFSPDRSVFVSSPHLPKWVGQCTTTQAEKILGMEVLFENDAALGALGEAVFGAGRGYGIVAYVTVGTGVGGARITHGALDATHFSFEIGQQLISMNGEVNTLENFVSGSAFEARYHQSPKKVHNPLIWEKVAQDLADGLYNTIVHWSPEVLVLGGSMMKDIPLSVLTERLHARMSIFPSLPDMRRGELGDVCGLLGALEYATKHRAVKE